MSVVNKNPFLVILILIINCVTIRGSVSARQIRDPQVQQVRPKYSNTNVKSHNAEQSANFRGDALLGRKDSTNLQGFASLRQHLNEERTLKKEDILAPNDVGSAVREQNYTGTPRHSPDVQYGGINTEQLYNKENDKMRLLYAFRKSDQEIVPFIPGAECNFERLCPWKTDAGFVVTNATNGIGPNADADNKSTGHYLLLHLKSSPTKQLNVTSPLFSPSSENCRMQLWIYQKDMKHNGTIRIVAKHVNSTEWVVNTIPIDNSQRWIKHDETIGKITQDFLIFIEVQLSTQSSVVALDNIKLLECFEESDPINSCTPFQYRCSQTNVCINNTRVCDIIHDCEYGDDETQNCEKMPYGSRCTFEQDWCGWYNVEGKALQWRRHNGPTPTNRTGPSYDHTYGNSTGQYMYVNMGSGLKDVGFASTATLNSIVFNPPPRVHGNISSRYYNSCMIRFYLHQYGSHKSGMMLQVTELKPRENVTKELIWSYSDYGDKWVRKIAILPNLTHKYYLHFDARKGLRYMGNIAIDDVSMSPECFGLNIPTSQLNHYNYWNPDFDRPASNKPLIEFENQTYYEFSSCRVNGRYGPVQDNCTSAYKNTSIDVKVLHAPGLNGIQKWIVPSEGYYTFIVLGASGGKGSGGMGSSRGAMVRTVVELRKGQEIFMLIGQEGTSSCLKSLGGHEGNSSCKSLRNSDSNNLTGIRGVLNMEVGDGGGGGGGGTFVFVHNRSRQAVPLAVAAGGGGLGLGRFVDTGSQHGQAINMSRKAVTGQMYGLRSAGAGGGWEMLPGQISIDHVGLAGAALLQGAIGGQACYNSTDGRGDGGFGGGGGGCIAGGGGGGYAGGNAWSTNTTNGEGGYSFLDPSRTIPSLSIAWSGYHAGPGAVIVIPAVVGCDCNYRCVALDVRRSQVTCVCPMKDWKLGADGKSCIRLKPLDTYPDWVVVILFFMLLSVLVAFGFVCFILYNRYQHRTVGILRRKMMSGPDLQLNRLRVASDNMITEYNPNYEFGGSICSVKDLKGIPRNQLQLQKALGQGAFGEVYQGFYRQRSGDAVEMPVAVKTLPAMSTQEAEVDFLMEALIMSQFNHPNIVHFIGVCFDKHPRFIVLELLAGGDLKNFLRESRPKPDKHSPLSMRDLVMISIDVAKGCQYMESHRFIHRDIAARNCLLTTKGPGRVVKIADFGMSRDIYRSDYYRKGGRAMLPIKWMPPEAFLDGIFTSKTDIWSFGVLLWEIMSMGYMPYTGCANRQVMQLVTSGGRLEPPANCPGPIYGMMTQCWHPEPDERPNFALILERLGYCTQDPDVMSAPLPIFTRPPSQEREQTIMRPGNDDHCIEISKVADYLIPNTTTIISGHNVIGSTSSVDKLLPENSDSWETSFVIPQSKSTQPLLQEIEQIDAGGIGSSEKLLAPELHKIEKVSPISLPTNILTNHVAKPKSESSLRSGISLDASALAKQTISPTHKKSYANINPDDKITGNGVIPNGPCTLKKDNGYISNPPSTYLNESINGISC